MDVEKLLGIKLKWYQRLYLNTLSRIDYTNRNTSKTGLNFMYMVENLKKKAKTEEEKIMYEQIQKEWAEFNRDLTLSYWQ